MWKIYKQILYNHKEAPSAHNVELNLPGSLATIYNKIILKISRAMKSLQQCGVQVIANMWN